MCKSADQPGGPYRCSGDMKTRLDAAEAAHSAAQSAVTAAREDMTRTSKELNAVRAAIPMPEDPAFADSERQMDAALKADATARVRWMQALEAESEARTRLDKAQRQYDATPAGLATLGQQYSAQSDQPGPESTNDMETTATRIARAEGLMDLEASMRGAPHTYRAMPQGGANSAEGLGALLSRDGIGGYSKQGQPTADESGLEYTEHAVTMSRQEGGKTLMVKTTYRLGAWDGSRAPECSEVVAAMAADARAAEGGFSSFCASRGVAEDAPGAKERFKSAESSGKRLRRFLGEQRYAEYVG